MNGTTIQRNRLTVRVMQKERTVSDEAARQNRNQPTILTMSRGKNERASKRKPKWFVKKKLPDFRMTNSVPNSCPIRESGQRRTCHPQDLEAYQKKNKDDEPGTLSMKCNQPETKYRLLKTETKVKE